ncbi:zinc finger protein 19-like isoform X1 [Acipenser oxyrinchus oxyrinchus]|uniref:Zinc finger protein 19-like isoform X1 n=1 Tax=Acipenser oxyrinchus oxyrinchus TaxID=40147 RepID=A0AAD8CJ78_ACIOX|nr:zinc finger protein 19-like isoform X1 [Acipenser oxyrinchus oxyrinchus]
MEEARVRPVSEMKEEMDMCASSASLLEEELASAIEPAVKAAVLSVMSALAKFVDSKCAVFHLRLDERDQEFESVRLRLEIAESELKAMRDGEYTNTGDKNFTQSLTNTETQYHGSDRIIAHGLPARDFTTLPVQPIRDPVPAVHTALKNSRVLMQEDGSYSEQDLLMRGDDSEQRDHTSTAGWRRALKGKFIFQSISSLNVFKECNDQDLSQVQWWSTMFYCLVPPTQATCELNMFNR